MIPPTLVVLGLAEHARVYFIIMRLIIVIIVKYYFIYKRCTTKMGVVAPLQVPPQLGFWLEGSLSHLLGIIKPLLPRGQTQS